MYCKNCNSLIPDGATFCANCGTSVDSTNNNPSYANMNNNYSKSIDNPSHAAGLASCCFPVVGLVLYFLWKDEKPNSARLVCYWMLGGTIAWVIFYILFFILGFIGSM